MRFADLVSTLGLLQGILLGIVIIAAHKPERPTRLLGLFILTLTLRILPFLLYRLPVGSVHPEVRWLPVYFLYSSLPLLYLYARRITGCLRLKDDWRHLIPGLLEIVLLSVLLANSVRPGAGWESATSQRIFTGYALLAIGPAVWYGYRIITFLNRSKVGISQYYSELVGKDLIWLKNSVVYLVALAAVYLALQFGPVAVDRDAVTIFGAVFNTVAIYYITIKGLQQFAIQDTTELQDLTTSPAELASEAEKPDLFDTVDRYVRDNQAYLNPMLTLADLSDALHISQRHLSRVINTGSGRNFNQYINRYRVAYSKRLLLDRAYDHYNLEGIAAESGFNNKATFYQSFKQYADHSPGAFRKHRESLADTE